MLSNRDTVRRFVVHEEGGYSGDARDGGNWSSGRVGVGALIGSNMGVGAPALIAWLGHSVTASFMRALPDSIQSAIFTARYWTPLAGDALPAGLDLMLVDFGWNRGTVTSARLLQQLLGVDADGAIGPDTLAAIAISETAALLRRPELLDVAELQAAIGVTADGDLGPRTRAAFAALAPAEALLVALAAAQVRSYRQLTNFPTYGTGWLARTVRRLSAARAERTTAVATLLSADNDNAAPAVLRTRGLLAAARGLRAAA
jgi:lysozyme family protein